MKNKLILSFIACAIVITSCKKNSENLVLEEVPAKNNSPYLSKVIEYKPAPGQYINDSGFGTLAGANALVGNTNGLVCLGGYGGSITFSFDHAIKNEAGADLGIFGNPIFGGVAQWSEPGIVCVMQDKNGNGLPDDTWYELAGSEYSKTETIKNYQITYFKPVKPEDDVRWEDNQGKSGVILKNPFHGQAMYPTWYTENQVVFKGTLLKNTLIEGEIITNTPFQFGYSDTGSPEYSKLQEDLGRGYNEFDLDWAVDANGQKVTLTQIDFVKVYTAQNCNGNPYEPVRDDPRSRYLGEISTEFGGAIDIKLYQQIKK